MQNHSFIAIADATLAAVLSEEFGPLDQLVLQATEANVPSAQLHLRRAGSIVMSYLNGIGFVSDDTEYEDLVAYVESIGAGMPKPTWEMYLQDARDS